MFSIFNTCDHTQDCLFFNVGSEGLILTFLRLQDKPAATDWSNPQVPSLPSLASFPEHSAFYILCGAGFVRWVDMMDGSWIPWQPNDVTFWGAEYQQTFAPLFSSTLSRCTSPAQVWGWLGSAGRIRTASPSLTSQNPIRQSWLARCQRLSTEVRAEPRSSGEPGGRVHVLATPPSSQLCLNQPLQGLKLHPVLLLVKACWCNLCFSARSSGMGAHAPWARG